MRGIGWGGLGVVATIAAAASCGGSGSSDGGAGSAGTGAVGGVGGASGSGGSGGGTGGNAASSGSSGSGGSTAGTSGAGGAPPDASLELIIASGQNAPTGIAIDATNVYWANIGDGSIATCPKLGCGSAGPTLLATGQQVVRGVAVDASSVFFMSAPVSGSQTTARVLKCPLGGCTGAPELVFESSAFRPNDVDLVGGTLYFTFWPSVGSCPASGCPTTTSYTSLTAGGGPLAVTADAQYLYLARVGWQTVARCALAGCGAGETELIDGITPLSIAVDATSLYISDYDHFDWVGGDDSSVPRILKCPLAGCGASGPQVVKSGDITPYAIAVDDERLYFTNIDQGTIVSIPK